MAGDERTTAFINSLDPGNTPFLDEIEKEAKKPMCRSFGRKCRALSNCFLQ